MEKKTTTENNPKNKEIGDDTFKIFSDGSSYNLKLNTNMDKLHLVISKEDTYENYESNLTFDELSNSNCFRLEEDIEEVKSAMMQYILENKILLTPKIEGLSVIFETQFNLKKLRSEFILNIQEENIENAVKFIKIKMNHLLNDSKNKEKLMKELELGNKEALNKIETLSQEVKKVKEMQDKQAKLIEEIKNKSLPPLFSGKVNPNPSISASNDKGGFGFAPIPGGPAPLKKNSIVEKPKANDECKIKFFSIEINEIKT